MLSTPPDFIVETSDEEKVTFKAEHASYALPFVE
jgi:hypothetical protein